MIYTKQQKDQIKAELNNHFERLARQIIDQPLSSHAQPGRVLKFGSKGGSLRVTVDPAHRNYGQWFDFQTQQGGDALKMIQRFKGFGFVEALDWAARDFLNLDFDQATTPRPPSSTSFQKRSPRTWTPLQPVPAHVKAPDLSNKYLVRPAQGKMITGQHLYQDLEGQTLGYVMRLESINERGKRIKETLPLTYCQNEEGHQHWRWQGFEVPRPLYGLPQLKIDRPILVVEGEKTADAARLLFPEMTVLTWMGGCQGVDKTDWTPLQNKNITLWSDHDEAGHKAVHRIATLLQQQSTDDVVLKIVDVPSVFAAKWDLADPLPKGWDHAQLKQLINQASQVTSYTLEINDQINISSPISQQQASLTDLKSDFQPENSVTNQTQSSDPVKLEKITSEKTQQPTAEALTSLKAAVKTSAAGQQTSKADTTTESLPTSTSSSNDFYLSPLTALAHILALPVTLTAELAQAGQQWLRAKRLSPQASSPLNAPQHTSHLLKEAIKCAQDIQTSDDFRSFKQAQFKSKTHDYDQSYWTTANYRLDFATFISNHPILKEKIKTLSTILTQYQHQSFHTDVEQASPQVAQTLGTPLQHLQEVVQGILSLDGQCLQQLVQTMIETLKNILSPLISPAKLERHRPML